MNNLILFIELRVKVCFTREDTNFKFCPLYGKVKNYWTKTYDSVVLMIGLNALVGLFLFDYSFFDSHEKLHVVSKFGLPTTPPPHPTF